MEATTKRCGGCGLVQPIDEFYFRNRERTKRQSFCRTRKSRYNRAWYRRNRHKQIADAQRNNARYRRRLRDIVAPLKDRPCADCGGRFPPECMDFDHLDDDDKLDDVSRLVHIAASIEVLLAELAKCELVCSNCHRIRTARRRREWGHATGRRISRPARGRTQNTPAQLRLFAVR